MKEFSSFNSLLSGLDKASVISAVGTTESMRVDWTAPTGSVSLYSVKLLLNGTIFKTENRTSETSVVFSGLLPGTAYNVVVSSISGPIKQDSDSVQNATCKTQTQTYTMNLHALSSTYHISTKG